MSNDPYGCSSRGIWKDSCDIAMPSNTTAYSAGSTPDTILDKADWSTRCDSWAEQKPMPVNDVYNNETVNEFWSTHRTGWVCPSAHRSVSGCGDMRDATNVRPKLCPRSRQLDVCDETIIMRVGEPSLPQKHVCVQHPIFYENYHTAGRITPPCIGRHREQWARWGEYAYCPPQRWVHNLEHGGVVFLYDPCLTPESVCAIRQYVAKWQAHFSRKREGFRFVMTPFKDLMRSVSVVAWGRLFASDCFNVRAMDRFITENYRHAWEDVSQDGNYDHLFIHRDMRSETASCKEGQMSTTQVHPLPIRDETGERFAQQKTMNMSIFTDMQMRIMNRRMEHMETKIRNHEAQLSEVKNDWNETRMHQSASLNGIQSSIRSIKTDILFTNKSHIREITISLILVIGLVLCAASCLLCKTRQVDDAVQYQTVEMQQL